MFRKTNKKETMVVGSAPDADLLGHFLAVVKPAPGEAGIVSIPPHFREADFIAAILNSTRISITLRVLDERTVAVKGAREIIQNVRNLLPGLGLMEKKSENSTKQLPADNLTTTRDMPCIEDGPQAGTKDTAADIAEAEQVA